MSPRALVVGARGQIGRFLLPRLQHEGWRVHATTRGDLPGDTEGIRWHRLDLFSGSATCIDLEVDVDVVFGLGPLDGLAQWLSDSDLRPRRVVAFGSTSIATKHDSIDPAERDVVERLRRAEAMLHAWATRAQVDLTILRPTLIYGAGIDRNLSRLVGFAQSCGFLLLPRAATGLRQPVHADDLAAAAARAAGRFGLPQSVYDLPGGETLGYREMATRVLACLDPPRRVIAVPTPLLRLTLHAAKRLGRLRDTGEAMLDRMQRDLVFDAGPAQRDLDYEPRPFQPRASMFVASETTR
jgi:nucleoside-diphosphate-sugar epimerase